MPVQDYISGHKRAVKIMTTLGMDLDEAYVKWTAQLRGPDGLVRDDIQGQIEPGAAAIEDHLVETGRKYTHSAETAKSDEFARMFILSNYNLGKMEIGSILRQMAQSGSLRAGGWSEFTQENLKPVFQKISNVPLNYLRPEDAADVIAKVDPGRRHNLDPSSDVWRDPRNLALLLNEYIAAGQPSGNDYNLFSHQFLNRYGALLEQGRRSGSLVTSGGRGSTIEIPRPTLYDSAGNPLR